jgi:hypothetical protein
MPDAYANAYADRAMAEEARTQNLFRWYRLIYRDFMNADPDSEPWAKLNRELIRLTNQLAHRVGSPITWTDPDA